MPTGFLFFSYPPKTTSAKPHQYERHKNHSRHSNITKRLPIRDIRPSQFATKRALERRKMSSKRSDIIPKTHGMTATPTLLNKNPTYNSTYPYNPEGSDSQLQFLHPLTINTEDDDSTGTRTIWRFEFCRGIVKMK